jgi:ribonuclease P protein component
MTPGRVGRLTTTAAFAALQRSRRRGRCGPVHAVFVPASEGAADAFPQVRVGYTVGKRCGSAVERNTLRRRMREVARATAPSLPSGSYLLRLSPEAVSLERARFRADVATALCRAAGADGGAHARADAVPGAHAGAGARVREQVAPS